ncbi:MAG: helix-turn-helix domain-containing protein, partial [Candidatus Hermodarchaeia archaeon]
MTPKESKPKSPPATAEEGSAAQCATPFEISSELQTAMQVRFKLTESQIRTYTALLIMGQLTADGISNYSGVPMVKVRSAIEGLEKKQLIKPLPGVVTRYRAFAPYQELSKEVKSFSKDTQKSWKELQKLQSKTLREIHDELQLMTRKVRSALENLNERQGIALNEAAMATNIVLSNVAENLQKYLNNLSSLSLEEISEQTTLTQQALNSLIDEGITHLDDAQKFALEDATKAIGAHQEDSKQWISSTADQLLARVTASNQQISTQLDDANNLLQRTFETGRNTVNTEIMSQKEGLAESTEETATTLTHDIDTYTKETKLLIDTSQKEMRQAQQKLKKDLTTSMQEIGTQRTQTLNNLVSQLEKSIEKENRRLAKQTDETAATMDSTIKSNLDASEQIIEGLFQDLKKAHNHSSLELRRLHKEAEATVTKWPPSSLSFAQFSKIQNSVSTLLEQVKTEHDTLLENTSRSVGSEMRDSYLAQLLEVQALLQSLIAESKTQKRALASNFKSISNQIGRRLKRRQRTIQKTAEAFLSDFRSQMELQEEQHQALSKKMQKLLRTEAAASVNALEVTASQLGKYAANQLKYAQGAIKQ